MNELEKMGDKELVERVLGHFDRLIKSLCDCGGNYQRASEGRTLAVELARRLSAASGALDELAEHSAYFHHTNADGSHSYGLAGTVGNQTMPLAHAQIARRKAGGKGS